MNFNDVFKQQVARRAVVEALAEDAKTLLAEPVVETEEQIARAFARAKAVTDAEARALESFAVHKPVEQIQAEVRERNPDIQAMILQGEITGDDLLAIDDAHARAWSGPEPTDDELELAIADAFAAERAAIPEAERLTEAQCRQTSAPQKSDSSSNSSPTSRREKQRIDAKQRRERAKAQKSGAGRKSAQG